MEPYCPESYEIAVATEATMMVVTMAKQICPLFGCSRIFPWSFFVW
jgi:hypothetical protein